ncbi:AtpZ/AtpI family protein [Brachyspira pilosicoli]
MNSKNNIKNGIKYTALGIEFGSIILGLAFVGNLADKKFNTSPLFTIAGIFFGFISGIYRLYQLSKIIERNKNR